MKDKDEHYVKRTQRDYNLGFKLAIVSEVEKGNYPLFHSMRYP